MCRLANLTSWQVRYIQQALIKSVNGFLRVMRQVLVCSHVKATLSATFGTMDLRAIGQNLFVNPFSYCHSE